MTRVAVLGGGRIGEALLGGLLATGRGPGELGFVERDPGRARELTERLGVDQLDLAAAGRAATVVVAVKPADVPGVLAALAGHLDPASLVVSLCAGVPTAAFEAALPAGVAVVRVMPNTPMLVGEAMSAISPGSHAGPDHLDTAAELLGSVGRVVRVAEHHQDAVTALSGSGPAWFFHVVEALVEGGVGMGLPRDVATELVVQTAIGAGVLLRDTAQHPALAREAVTSPAGTTAAGLRELDRHGVRAALVAAVEAARDRSVELGRTSG